MSTPAPTIPGSDPTANPTPPASGNGGTPPPASASFSQEQVDAIIKDRLERQQRAIDAKTAKDREAAEATRLAEQGEFKQLAQTAQQEVATLKAQLADLAHADLQRQVTAEQKLPPEMAPRLQGTSRDELTADAKALAKLLAQPPAAPGSAPSPRPGAPSKSLVEQETERMRASGKYARG